MSPEKKMIGCVADDFTGAGDAASFLQKGGLRTMLLNGISKEEMIFEEEYDAVVIALKTRTIAKEEAVGQTLMACRKLKAMGATQLYFKYCSTFDSTKKGNIGPVLDAMLEEFHGKRSILCPALPINQRIVLGGRLYVDGTPLQESPMKNHPLTPMWDCEIAKLMEPQSIFSTLAIDATTLMSKRETVQLALDKFEETNVPYYVVPDYITEEHGRKIVEIFGDDEILSGGSGLLYPLAQHLTRGKEERKTAVSQVGGSGLILAGSCSQMTLRQIAAFQACGGIGYQIIPEDLISGKETVAQIWEFVMKHSGRDVLVYSSQEADQVKISQSYGRESVAQMLEDTMAALAEKAVESGFQRLIVAGGETSGAVIVRLGFDGFFIGESVAPGVPILLPIGKKDVRVILKSGNFGEEDFFIKAVKMTGGYL